MDRQSDRQYRISAKQVDRQTDGQTTVLTVPVVSSSIITVSVVVAGESSRLQQGWERGGWGMGVGGIVIFLLKIFLVCKFSCNGYPPKQSTWYSPLPPSPPFPQSPQSKSRSMNETGFASFVHCWHRSERCIAG